jgi:hypothetical protein
LKEAKKFRSEVIDGEELRMDFEHGQITTKGSDAYRAVRTDGPSRRLIDSESSESSLSCMGQSMSITFRLSTRLSSPSTPGLWLCRCYSFSDGLGGASKLATGLTSPSAPSLWVGITLGFPTRLTSPSTPSLWVGVTLADLIIFWETEAGVVCFWILLSFSDDGCEVSCKFYGMSSSRTVILRFCGGLCKSIGERFSGALDFVYECVRCGFCNSGCDWLCVGKGQSGCRDCKSEGAERAGQFHGC